MNKEALDRLFPYCSERGLVGKRDDSWEGKTREEIATDIWEMMALFRPLFVDIETKGDKQ